MLPETLMQRFRAFQESRVLLTAVELDLFNAVGSGATAGEVASARGADPRATAMLMHALVSLGMLEKRAVVFHNTPDAARYFVKGSPDDVRLALMHYVNLWRRWDKLTRCVRAGTAVQQTEQAERGEDWTAAFIAAMHALASARAPQVVRAVGVAGARRMLDIGGGSGAYSIAFAQADAELHVEILDLPAVVPIADGHIREAGLSGRVTTRAGDLATSDFGQGRDLVLISAICHMLGPEENQALVRRAFAALGTGGRIVISDFLLEPDRTGPLHATLFALNMLVGTRDGDTYTEQEYASWLAEAGFTDIRRIDLPGPASLMVATRG